jgi:hypothetical protein
MNDVMRNTSRRCRCRRCILHPPGAGSFPPTPYAGGNAHPGLNADMNFPEPVYFTDSPDP